ncbi:DNA glycosylase AlkZ-like family protein [Nonomuraea sp. LPB2021202275-12-8]|uniref:DNA glycosylase AlkZ-like family protein n=1 Tax=Nonomuraea sp. LPB2021202275-12-8 TaxID=3120159 RepID=UPI00300C2388
MIATLDRRRLNRATLARQFLLRRVGTPAVEVIEHLTGLQAQDPDPPYVGLWTRIDGFRIDDLTRLLQEREVVRATLFSVIWRGTPGVHAREETTAREGRQGLSGVVTGWPSSGSARAFLVVDVLLDDR